MSETTSTNISVAQANSTESIQATSTRQSRMTGPGSNKRICFYKSGDPRFHGIKMVVTNRSFKTFDALLDSLSKKVPLPFGVRNITTPRGIHQVTSLEDLEDGKSYICSHQKKVKPINLERASKKPLLWQSSRPLSARRRAMHLTRPSEVAPFQRENTVVLGSSKNFVIYKNGEKEHKYNLILNKKSIQTFDAFLDQISEALQFPVLKLYSTDGRRILSTHALLLSSGTIVAAGREPFKPGNYDSEADFLPAKLPGIYQRVIPKSKAKPAIRSQVKSNKPVTMPADQEQLHSSANVFTEDENLVDFSQVPGNEIHLTEQWPKSGEDLPVISPGDNIEKSVHINCDGSMTVEMKVRFKIREEETINWSTTVSRAGLSYYKKKLFCSSVNPEVQDISISDSPKIRSHVDNNTTDESKDSVNYTYKSHAEKVQNLIQENDINTNKYKTSPARKEKQHFYRPPTPGIRKGQERRLSTRRASEGKLQENMKQMLSFNEMEHDSIQSVNDIVDHCSKHMLTSADSISNRTIKNQTETNCQYEKNSSKLEKESIHVVETARMELLHRNTVYEKGVRKSDQSDYICFTGDRPHSAGMQIHYQDPFKFKEIKRSMSASITFTDPPTLDEEVIHANNDCKLSHKDAVSQGNTITQIVSMVSTNSTREAPYGVENSAVTSRENMVKVSDNDTYPSNDNNSISSVGHKKKKKKKIKEDSLKQTETNFLNSDQINLESPQVVCGISGGGMNPATKNIMFEEIFPPQMSSTTNQSELGTIKKIKGDKQMAKVKPRSVKTNDKSFSSPNQNSEESEEKKDNTEAADYSTAIVSNGSIVYTSDQAPFPLTLNKYVPDELVSTTGASKRSQKAAKKPKQPKKKAKNTRVTETKTANSSNRLDSERALYSPALPYALESYVQSWLKNIFPNTALPVLQLISSGRLEDDVLHSSKDSADIQPHAEATRLVQGEVCGNATNREIQGEPIYTQSKEDSEIFIHQTENLSDFFAQQCTDFDKAEELIKRMATQQQINVPSKKASTDAAVQVENETLEQELVDYLKCDYMADMLSSQNLSNSNCKQLEKSFSLPNSPCKPSSAQLLLAWLIVLHLKQGMHNTTEDMSSMTSNNYAIFNLLQSLKKIAITEKADDLKAAILSLQESAITFDSVLKNVPTANKSIPMHESPQIPTKRADNDQLDCMDFKYMLNTQTSIESCERSALLHNDNQYIFADESDDLMFFATESYREVSGEQCQKESGENPEQCSLPLQEIPNITGVMEVEGSLLHNDDNNVKFLVDLSQRCIPSPVTHINDHTMETSTCSAKKVSKVKMMVQEMEQRKYSSNDSEHPKCLQSPISSDWSDYRQDSEESMSDNLRSSSEIMTESGEEQVQKKVFTTGYVKRTIERLYGKAESKVKMFKTPSSVSPTDIIQTQPKKSPNNKNTECVEVYQSMSKENILRSISSPSNKIKIAADNLILKSASLPLLEAVVDHDSLISQKSRSSQGKQSNKDGHEKTGTDGGILIDKGRWLLKENHLVRRSPPELIGMYTNLDTTSADTLLDNTSDDVPYRHYASNMNQPLVEVSSSELEDMAKPQHNTCNYFTMPHGSDSEPFNDTFSTKSKVRPKSSDASVKSKRHESIKKCGAISTSLTSFATVDFHHPENKVHPMPQPDAENTNDGQTLNPTSANRRQVKEQDSLDKLQVICGQHCPILTAIITPINETDRGFAYCRRYDTENLMMLHSLPTTTTLIPLLNRCPYVDENNNIENNMTKLPIINITDKDTHFPFSIDYKDILGGVKAFQSMIESKQTVSTLHSISIIKMAKIMKQYKESEISHMFPDVTCVGNDENNNILFSNT